MFDRILNLIAGVDGKLIATCPPTDKMWARQLGYSLCLSFAVVFGVSVYSLGYIIPELWLRIPVALVIALTLFLFDRALFQSDWFQHGHAPDDRATVQTPAEAGRSLVRFFRIGMRLAISLVLASVIATFLELAMFSSTITERIEADRVAANQPLFDRMAAFEAGVNADIDRQKASLASLQQTLQESFEPSARTTTAPLEALDAQLRTIDRREEAVLAELAQITPTIQGYASEMNAEEFGQRLNADSTMRPGIGPRYEFAKRQKAMLDRQADLRMAELAQLRSKRETLQSERSELADQAARQHADAAAQLDQRRAVLQAEIAAAQAGLQQSQASRQQRLDAQWRKLKTEMQYREADAASDPLTRMAAFQDLKNDPKQGTTITAVSWMTRLFIIFLEVVPVIAKIFFSPPSVYAARLQAEIARGRRRVEERGVEDVTELDPAAAPSLAPAQVAELVAFGALNGRGMFEPDRRVEDRRKLVRRAAQRGTGKKTLSIPRVTRTDRPRRVAAPLLPA